MSEFNPSKRQTKEINLELFRRIASLDTYIKTRKGKIQKYKWKIKQLEEEQKIIFMVGFFSGALIIISLILILGVL